MSELEVNRLTRALLARRAKGLPILDLTCSNPAEVGLGWEHHELAPLLSLPGIERHEPDPLGLPLARQAISDYLSVRGVHLPKEQIGLSASTSEAYAGWFRLLAEPGDNLLVPEPAYPLIDLLAAHARVEVRPYRCVWDGAHWVMDATTLKPDARTRAIVVIAPANPTGHTPSVADLRTLAQACEQAAPECVLLIDEVFLDYGATSKIPQSLLGSEILAHLPRVALSGLSKVALAPQLKVGWSAVAGPASWVDSIMERWAHLADTFLSVNLPAQLALPALLAQAPAKRAQVKARCQSHAHAVQTWCRHAGVGCCAIIPAAGWSLILQLPPGVDEVTFTLRAVEEGVYVHPGHYYDLGPEMGPCGVMSLLTPEATLTPGLAALARTLARS